MSQFLHSSGGVSLTDLLKDGSKHFSGIDEAVLKNIEACKKLSTITRTSIGPNGMNKMVINHLNKIFVTNDAATIVKEMEVTFVPDQLLVSPLRFCGACVGMQRHTPSPHLLFSPR